MPLKPRSPARALLETPSRFQRILYTVNSDEQRRALKDVEVSMNGGSNEFIVGFYGALFREVRRLVGRLSLPRMGGQRTAGVAVLST